VPPFPGLIIFLGINPLTPHPQIADHLTMKTTLEIPDSIVRRAKSKAAKQGMSLRQFVTEALRDKLKQASIAGQRPWIKQIGKLRGVRNVSRQVDALIAEVFDQADPQIGAPSKPQ